MPDIAGKSGQSVDEPCTKPIAETAPDDGVVAIVQGKVVEELPNDLYIPPDALKYFLKLLRGLWICCCT